MRRHRLLGDKVACPRGGKFLPAPQGRTFLLVLRFLGCNSLQPELKIAFGVDVRLKEPNCHFYGRDG
jgi:hypothetical protein